MRLRSGFGGRNACGASRGPGCTFLFDLQWAPSGGELLDTESKGGRIRPVTANPTLYSRQDYIQLRDTLRRHRCLACGLLLGRAKGAPP